MAEEHFDGEAFFSALDSHRQAKRLTWKRVAEEAEVSASTLTRLGQGKRPDVDSLAALCTWASISADSFFINLSQRAIQPIEPLTQITTYLRADPNLTKEGAQALEAILKTAYEQLRKG